MKKIAKTFIAVTFAIVALTSCEDIFGGSGRHGHDGQQYPSLEACIRDKVDNSCNCYQPNYPNGPAYMQHND